jgi:pSer/pThr/pTyr-binding forkhead associated (FHA) protein/pimeloyl-ACP methyl ester carboxylesterase
VCDDAKTQEVAGMEPTSFFDIRVDGPPATSGGPEDAKAAESAYTVRLGWIETVPYVIDLGSAGKVLVNDTPIEPYRPVLIQAGDRITIGTARFTLHGGAEADRPTQEPAFTKAPRETVELPREVDQEPEAVIPVEPASPQPETEEAAPDEAIDATLLIPKQMADQARAETPDPTLPVPKRIGRPPETETPEATLLVPKAPAKPPGTATPGGAEVAPQTPTELPSDATTYQTAWVDMAQIVEQDADREFVSTTILRDNTIPHLVLHLPDQTWEVQLTGEPMAIGRSRDNTIHIADESVSHHHALIEPRGDGYSIRDVGSRNGIWLGRRRVEEHRLSDGDVLSLGRAKLVFRSGFTSDDLTLIGIPRIDGKPTRRPVVFVPGMMGSELWIGSERLWPNPRLIISNPEAYALPGDPRIEARGIVNDVVIVPHIIQSRQYSALGDYLVESLGYTRGKDLLEFGYDWRHDVRLAAQRLADIIERWQVQHPITIIAHSLGTLVTRYYVERLGGKQVVERIILMGGPHHGTPGGLAAILTGPGILPFGMGAERLRDVLATLPSAYQILPTYHCAVDQSDNYIDLLKDESWLPEHQRPFLRVARSFRRELGTASSVPAVSIFGYGLKTKLRVKFHRRNDGLWERADFVEDSAGDQSVPSGSAVLKDSEIHPVFQEHGSLYVDDSVRMRLKVELTRSTTWQGRK